MSKPDWWTHCMLIVKRYPVTEKKLRSLQSEAPPVSPQLSGMPHSSAASRKTEEAALRAAPGETELRQYAAVARALEITRSYPNGSQRVRIVELLIWQESHTVEGAAAVVGYSAAAVKEFRAAFLGLVAVLLGFVAPWEMSARFYKAYPGLLRRCPELRSRCEAFLRDADPEESARYLRELMDASGTPEK